ncbi:MAG TPA: NUDIX domain-containing protein [Candidatus Pullichristensenella excrementipullorum]|nr:NUDIX domain-containing protein [Candidatus Pullichristensenella excrementipullorum]
MPVRNSAKALVLRGGKLLVNRCTSRFGEYYALPGGGQREGETLLEAVRRELLEETGYRVLPMRLSAIYERVCAQREGGMSHKLYFVFLCRLEDEKERVPTERDRYQVGMEWVEVEALRKGDLFPRAIRDNLPALLGAGETIYLGSERER